MIDLCIVDFHIPGKPSAWDLALMIGDPQMIKIVNEGRLRIQKREWRKQEQKLEAALEYIADDELVEITPGSLRLRKMLLSQTARKRAGRQLAAT